MIQEINRPVLVELVENISVLIEEESHFQERKAQLKQAMRVSLFFTSRRCSQAFCIWTVSVHMADNLYLSRHLRFIVDSSLGS